MKTISLFLALLFLVSCNGSKDDSSSTGEDLAEDLDMCNLYGAPTSLNYSSSFIEVLKNVAIPSVSPTYNSALPVSFRVSPELPAGVDISLITGVVNGSPSVPGDRTYTLIAANQCGTATFDFRLKVKEFAPSALNYPSLEYSINIGDNFPTISPTVGNSPTLFSVTPALPGGMSIDPSNGIITGKPFESQAQTSYVVTASNSGGSTATTIKITVVGKPPVNLTYQSNSRTYKAGITAVNNYPLYSGETATSFNISPSLPEGLVFNSTTGLINGNAEEVRDNQLYTITAINQWGNATAQINLSVLPHVNGLVTGFEHTCLIKNRKVRCQGRNDLRQLGYSSTSTCQNIENDSFNCSRIMDYVKFNNAPLRATDIASASHTSCAIGLDQKVYCWGSNELGQAGVYNNLSIINLPQVVKTDEGIDLNMVSKVQAGLNHFCAQTTDNKLYCWGDNTLSQLGVSVVLQSNHALLVGESISDFAVGSHHTCKITSGIPSCVGSNNFSQLSNTSVTQTSSFVNALKFAGAFSLVSRVWGGDTFSVFKDNNSYFASGRNASGELGLSDLTEKPLAVPVLDESVVSIVTGRESLCYTISGLGFCQGLNDNNFANPAGIGAANPTALEIMEDVSLPFVNIELISQGYSSHRCVARNGEVYCFGQNYLGQVSSEVEVVKIYPIKVETP